VSAAAKREIARAIKRLRTKRDALPTVPGVDRSCGNLGANHDEGGCFHSRCGQPVQMWSRDAWDLEYAARELERRVGAS
jgi:hypothetical protein